MQRSQWLQFITLHIGKQNKENVTLLGIIYEITGQ